MVLRFGVKAAKQLAAMERAFREASRAEPWARDAIASLSRRTEAIMTVAKRLCPVDKGTLRASGRVESPRVEGASVIFRLSFGGAASAYALRVHEDVTVYHKVGQAKFLETPIKASEQGMLGDLRETLRARLQMLKGARGIGLGARAMGERFG